eukprot:TRINITY_DN28207_c0_g1_i1.p1 TRINITY_DN28207_c0_g1~~TRINITY_DN28207_c0_g1_i1.p1  ORF type:complete len:116 (+),score=34.47 TRINITY_DN28207_c0_g1_i1:64-411(+)
MHRKHKDQKGAPAQETEENPETPENSDSEDSETASEPVADESVAATYQCKYCPKVYSSAGSRWQHKRTKHPEMLNSKGASPLVSSPSLKITAVKASPGGKKDYTCQVCTKLIPTT